MPPPIDLTRFTAARGELARAEQTLAAAQLELATLRQQRDTAAGTGAAAGEIAAIDRRLATAAAKHRDARGRVELGLGGIRELGEELVAVFREPAELVQTLDGRVPVALLPVRLETRWSDAGRTLRIRVYPDQLHLDSHEPALTPAEVAAGHEYWIDVSAAPGDEALRREAWRRLTSESGAPRARWVVEALRPTSVAAGVPSFPEVEVKAESWTRAARATALPDRWVAIGRRRGRAVFTAWSQPVPDWVATTPSPGAQEDDHVDPDPDAGVALEEQLRWLTDYDAAEALGMAITVRAGQDGVGELLPGLDQLVVLGVDWTLSPTDAAARLDELLTSHRFTDGLAFVPPGTPTNQTSAARAGAGAPSGRDRDALEPDETPAGAPVTGSAAARMASALGLPGLQLAAAPGGSSTYADTASLLHDVVWGAALGYYLDELMEPLFSDDRVAELRLFTARNLQPGGPLAALRIGNQPYGVLPVVASSAYAAPDPTQAEAKLFAFLQRMTPPLLETAAALPRMGRSEDPGADMIALLQRTPIAQRARFRQATGPSVWANIERDHAAGDPFSIGKVALSAWTEQLLLPPVRLGQLVCETESYRLPVPWVQGGVRGTDWDPVGPLTPNYLAEIAALIESPTGRAELAERQDADTLLEALTAFAATEELDAVIAAALRDKRIDDEVRNGRKGRSKLQTLEVIGVLEQPREDDVIRIDTHEQLANLVVPGISGQVTIAESFAEMLRRPDTIAPDHPVLTLKEYVERLRELSTRPVAELDHAFRGYLDATSHRPDAWYTALATERLQSGRDAGTAGVHVGAWGIVERLRPDVGRDSLGYVHAPSISHAQTSALLRAGHLSHRGDGADRFDLQLSSERVRAALPVLEGVAEGQAVATLLGYHLERAIHEDVLQLARFVLPLRRLAPLRPSVAPPDDAGSVEAIAARDVVDGVKLLQLWKEQRTAIFPSLTDAAAPTPDERARLTRHLDDLAAIADAVGDLLIAETVHQTVLGNHERAGAALAALDRQQRPPELEFIKTPRTGLMYAQKVCTMMTGGARAPGWSAASTDVRAAAAPRVDAWVSRLLPSPDRIAFAGRLTHADGTTQERTVGVLDLGLSPLSLIAVAASGSGDRASELEQRIAAGLVAGVDLPDGATLELLEDSPAAAFGNGAEVGLGALRATLGWMRSLLSRGRPANPADLALPDENADRGVDIGDLAARADGAEAALRTATAGLESALGSTTLDADTLHDALLDAAAVACDGAVPLPGVGADAARAVALAEQAEAMLRGATSRVATMDELATALAEADPPLSGDALVEHHTTRLRTVLGNAFPVVPRFTLGPDPTRAAALGASLADRTALTGGDALAPRGFIDRMALVRPATKELADVLLAAETLGAPAAASELVQVAQLPHVPGQRWMALPFAASGDDAAGAAAQRDEADLAVLLHADGPLELTGALAGIVVDEYHETIPADTETTGVTFHYDAPAARAPQMVLLAVPPTVDQTSWSLDGLLAVVDEAMTLARLRSLAPQDMPMVGPLLPMTWLPHRFTKDRTPPPFAGMLKRFGADVLAEGVIGKLYTPSGG